MFYICVEEVENRAHILNILNYEPAVPASVTVYPITEKEHVDLLNKDIYFDLKEKKLLPVPQNVKDHRLELLAITNGHVYLSQTDWKVLRHLREKTLGIPTTLSEEELHALETKRHEVAAKLSK